MVLGYEKTLSGFANADRFFVLLIIYTVKIHFLLYFHKNIINLVLKNKKALEKYMFFKSFVFLFVYNYKLI